MQSPLIFKAIIAALCCFVFAAVADTAPAVISVSTDVAIDQTLDDGPYATYERDNAGLSVVWVCKGKKIVKAIPKTADARIDPECGYPKPITVRDGVPGAGNIHRQKNRRAE
jgi:hypothetical protein